jgi:hypothetical protein
VFIIGGYFTPPPPPPPTGVTRITFFYFASDPLLG